MMQTPGNPHVRLATQLAALLLVAATGGLLLLTLSERTVNGNLNGPVPSVAVLLIANH